MAPIMIRYGLKLWSTNQSRHFLEAAELLDKGQADFVEINHNPTEQFDYARYECLKGRLVAIHNTHSHGWHEFALGPAQIKIWQETLALADYFSSPWIVVHPGQARDFDFFRHELQKIDDPRILIENMAGTDIYGGRTFGRTLAELRTLRQLKNICFDFEKAVKAACFQQIDYKDFIHDCLRELDPVYFHISGGDKDTPVDEHLNVWEATFDVGWVAKTLAEHAANREVLLVFETPKVGEGLENDVKNIEFFRKQTV